MKAFIRWVVVTIFQDVASRVLSIISVMGGWALVQIFCPDYFNILSIPILIAAPLIIVKIIYPMPKDR